MTGVHKFTEFHWTGRREEAALLVAEDNLSDERIAERLSITRQGLVKWKRHPAFQERVKAVRDEIRAAVVARGIADKQNRVDALNERWARMHDVIESRASAGGDAPGASTGLLYKTIKVVGSGKDQYEVEEWAVDTGLLREMREHEKQAAQELGQWTEKVQTDGKLEIVYVNDWRNDT